MQPGAAPKEPPLQGSRLAVAAYVGSSKRDIPDADITAALIIGEAAHRVAPCQVQRLVRPLDLPYPGTSARHAPTGS